MEPEIYEFGGVRLDLRLLKVTRDCEPVSLEPKTLDVLRYLGLNPTTCCSSS